VSTESIATANHLSRQGRLIVGQILKIPREGSR